MVFIVILIALLMERFFHWQHFREWRWFINYERWLSGYSLRLPDAVRLVISILPPLLIVILLNHIFSRILFGIPGLIFGIFIMLYCLGPRNLWVQVTQCIDAMRQQDAERAMLQAKKDFGVTSVQHSDAFHKELLGKIFIAAYDRIFSVIFWFLLLGPVGAVLYRLLDLFSTRGELGLTESAIRAKDVMDWLPVRAFTFVFALAGDFAETFSRWKMYARQGLQANQAMLVDCGFAALDVQKENAIPEQDALDLLDRVFVIVLVVLALVVVVV